MPRLNYETLMKINPIKIRTLKAVNDELANPLPAVDLVLKAIRLYPGSIMGQLVSITGLAKGTIGKGVLTLIADKLIYKSEGKGISILFHPVD